MIKWRLSFRVVLFETVAAAFPFSPSLKELHFLSSAKNESRWMRRGTRSAAQHVNLNVSTLAGPTATDSWQSERWTLF
jgi:hypothetical protein